MKKFVIIDGNSLLNRAFYALPMLANFEGEISNGVFGFTNILVKILTELKPDYLCVAFDYGKKTFRHSLYAQYKGTRKPTPPQLVSQFPILKNLLKTMNIEILELPQIEADDIIGTLTKKFETENLVVTGDKDSFQLINANTKVMFTKKGVSETQVYDREILKREYGIYPEQVTDLKALMGDASDNIPGVQGIGEKTAVSLLEKYETLDGVYAHVDELKGKLLERLMTDKETAYLSKTLATIDCDVPMSVNLDQFIYDFPFKQEVLKLFEKYQFNSLLKRPDLFADATYVAQTLQSNKEKLVQISNAADLSHLISACKGKHITLTMDQTLNIACDQKEYCLNFNLDMFSAGLDMEESLNALKPLLSDEHTPKTVYDYKGLLHKLHDHGIALNGVVFDVMIARYLINNNAKSNVSLSEVITEQNGNLELPASSISTIAEAFEKRMRELELTTLFSDMEMPLSRVLFDMEIAGFKIDIKELSDLDEKYADITSRLLGRIYETAGITFNVNSPKQLSDVLFNKLGIKAYNNKKNSTGIDILNDIASKHAVVPLIIEYRKMMKIYSTYVKAFGQLYDKETHKIHTLFNQTNTATGRLSSNEPNLQNIPIRSEEGKEFRKIFIPSQPSGFIVSADYSQIELRLMASFSGDEKFIQAFLNGEDIHATTASEVFGIALKDITPALRRDAKAINFGIIYGISDYGLSQNIGTSRAVAGQYITRYFERYPKIKTYMEQNVAFCKEHGFVKTLFGRIRFIPEIASANYNLRQFGERAAMNMPLQGSASDIIKLAMVKVANQFEQKNLKSKLILQIHDELLVDCCANELNEVKSILKNCMEQVVALSVPLTVNIEYGKNWYEAK